MLVTTIAKELKEFLGDHFEVEADEEIINAIDGDYQLLVISNEFLYSNIELSLSGDTIEILGEDVEVSIAEPGSIQQLKEHIEGLIVSTLTEAIEEEEDSIGHLEDEIAGRRAIIDDMKEVKECFS